MNTLTIVVLACLAVLATAKPSGHWDGDDGRWDGGWDDGNDGGDGGDDGKWDDGNDGKWDDGHWGPHSNVVHGNGATLVGAVAGHAKLVGPSVHGNGGDGAGWGHGWVGGDGGWGHGHGVVVKGPPTVPATIVGPSGKIHAKGLWGPTHAHGHHGHW